MKRGCAARDREGGGGGGARNGKSPCMAAARAGREGDLWTAT
jgi:hypothetical protein